jgi:hypothetical protein
MSDDQSNTKIWEKLLITAVYTPSPHNAQPWRLRVSSDHQATLFVERARMMPDSDTSGHFIRSSMGMFIEALTLISANAGYTLRHQLLCGGSESLVPFAELELQPGAQPSAYPDILFRKRATSRLGSNGVRISAGVAEHLSQFEPQHGQRYHQLDDPMLIDQLVQENIRAVFHDLNDRAYHDEIAKWFRCNDAEASSKADGLDYRCMLVGATELKLIKHLPQIMRWRLTRPFMRWLYRRQLGAVSHLGIISGLFFDDVGCMHAGAYLLRFWLELARHDLYIHPFGNLVTNAQAKNRLDKLTGIGDAWLVFRIGHTNEPPRSHRRSVHEVLLRD